MDADLRKELHMKQFYVTNKKPINQYNLGYKQGWHDANEKNTHVSTDAIYAVIMLTLHTYFGWEKEDLEKLLAASNEVSASIIPSYGSADAMIKAVSDELGLSWSEEDGED